MRLDQRRKTTNRSDGNTQELATEVYYNPINNIINIVLEYEQIRVKKIKKIKYEL
jgi:hypothetical protein